MRRARRVAKNADTARGSRFTEISKIVFGCTNRSEWARQIGCREGSIADWESGADINNRALAAIVKRGGSLAYLLLGDGSPISKHPVVNAAPAIVIQNPRAEITVIGYAAADNVHASKAQMLQPQDMDEECPRILMSPHEALVRIMGDSMAPVILDGQYAVIEYQEFPPSPRNGSLVIVRIDEGEDGKYERYPGYYCKRFQDGGSMAIFTSVNVDPIRHPPFSALKANCRMWEVTGVRFAGQGKWDMGWNYQLPDL